RRFSRLPLLPTGPGPTVSISRDTTSSWSCPSTSPIRSASAASCFNRSTATRCKCVASHLRSHLRRKDHHQKVRFTKNVIDAVCHDGWRQAPPGQDVKPSVDREQGECREKRHAKTR